MIVLGIETSCDETSVAIVTGDRQIVSHITRSQIDIHQLYGGVVPEVAARSHLDHLPLLVEKSLKDAKMTLSDMSAIAVTAGPGLMGGLLVGVNFAKALCAASNVPFLAINHLAGHGLTARLSHDVSFPFLLLLVSGGHSQLLIVSSADDYHLLGESMDDAVGEAFDKTARLLGFPYPGGPAIEQLAKSGDGGRYPLPRPLLHDADRERRFTFSLSGLKTAVRQLIESHQKKGGLTHQMICDIAASFQGAVCDILANRSVHALDYCRDLAIPITAFVVSGGVAANAFIGKKLDEKITPYGIKLVAPPLNLCTDNAAMIAWAGIEKLRLGIVDGLDFVPRPRWPLHHTT